MAGPADSFIIVILFFSSWPEIRCGFRMCKGEAGEQDFANLARAKEGLGLKISGSETPQPVHIHLDPHLNVLLSKL